ncbi:hypothetical protein KXQ82_16765 [Mucilaginibacter sp. HMF5004]|uniref:hypothetical protein n=1 Tax=Mucilaginibacter rivuli TaxID=2857527 RepID=UPI001C5E1B92|nr:hypothetical protein [Mucilaginibacter rivuli]MBW4891383.1 hypothetical protein [Mucilaginibacter rivuli]
MRNTALGLLLFIFIPFTSLAQQAGSNPAALKQLRFFEDSLKSLGNKVINHPEALERKNANYTFIKTLVGALQVSGSYSYGFDSVKSMSIINAPDNKFRLMTWHVMNSDGSYRFYGAIQMNSTTLKLVPLEDYSPLLKNPEDSVVDNRKWYGAQYYKIIQVSAATPYYVLVGWKGNTEKSTKKVIDVISFKNDKPVFGAPVFDGNGKTRKRVIFEYNRLASMLLRYVPSQNTIVFDHLVPPDPKMKGKFDTYGPDMSYCGYRLKEGRWVYIDNIDMRNMPDAGDDQLVDPKKQALLDKQRAAAGKN